MCRATFAAELFAVLDGIGAALKVTALYEEILTGPKSAATLAALQDDGKYTLEVHACTDARSVFDSVANPKAVKATEEHLLVHILKLKEFIKNGLVKGLWWVDTRDMVADGLTKGVLDRAAILALTEQGLWTLQHDAVCLPRTT